jgi:excisionase family DNA binding protein
MEVIIVTTGTFASAPRQVYIRRVTPPGWLTTAQVAERLNLKQQQVRDMLRAGKFPNADRVSDRLWLIPESDLENVKLPKVGRPHKRRGRPPKVSN